FFQAEDGIRGFHVTGVQTCALPICSRRVRFFAESLQIPGIANAAKPIRRAFRRAMRIMGTRPEQTAVIGDQVFTDVLGGNRMNSSEERRVGQEWRDRGMRDYRTATG